MLAPGTPAPQFSLRDQRGDLVTLASFLDHWVLLWWYPKAATPG
jgi:thioredoxin-dependent peroxiredoxin